MAPDEADVNPKCAICTACAQDGQERVSDTCGHAVHGPCLDAPWASAERGYCHPCLMCRCNFQVAGSGRFCGSIVEEAIGPPVVWQLGCPPT